MEFNTLVQIGYTFCDASRDVCGRFRISEPAESTLLQAIRASGGAGLVLSTCDRLELYVSCAEDRTSSLEHALWHALELPAETPGTAEVRTGRAVAEHLLRVAAGLKSRLVGETRIQGQVRDAYLTAQARRQLKPVLDALCRAAIRTGKRVRTETSLGRSAPSLGAIVRRQLIEHRIPNEATVAVVGSGKVAEDLLVSLPVRRQLIARNPDRGRELARRFDCTVSPWEDLVQTLEHAAAAVFCTSARTHVVGPQDLSRKKTDTQLLIDLGVPPNVHPATGTLPGVRLISFHELIPAVPGDLDPQRQAETIVQEECRRFEGWARRRSPVGDTVTGRTRKQEAAA